MRITYECTRGGLLLGDPRRGSSVWTIFYAPSFESSDYQPVGITSAWW
jgi:hypothetical protein